MWFLQRVRIARNAERCNSHGRSSRLSVCPSVTFRCFVETNKQTIVRSLASGKTIILVSGEVKFIQIFAGGPPARALKWSAPSLAKMWPIIGHISVDALKTQAKTAQLTTPTLLISPPPSKKCPHKFDFFSALGVHVHPVHPPLDTPIHSFILYFRHVAHKK